MKNNNNNNKKKKTVELISNDFGFSDIFFPSQVEGWVLPFHPAQHTKVPKIPGENQHPHGKALIYSFTWL